MWPRWLKVMFDISNAAFRSCVSVAHPLKIEKKKRKKKKKKTYREPRDERVSSTFLIHSFSNSAASPAWSFANRRPWMDGMLLTSQSTLIQVAASFVCQRPSTLYPLQRRTTLVRRRRTWFPPLVQHRESRPSAVGHGRRRQTMSALGIHGLRRQATALPWPRHRHRRSARTR